MHEVSPWCRRAMRGYCYSCKRAFDPEQGEDDELHIECGGCEKDRKKREYLESLKPKVLKFRGYGAYR